MNLLKDTKVRNAVMIGSMCSISYLAVYFARNILGAVSPQMIEQGVFTKPNIGTMSSVYFISYGFGQLINGAIGDKIKSKYMISFGLALAGICTLLFSLLASSLYAAYVVYGMTGFFLAMIYGPMTKVVAENTEPKYATRCSLGYTFASFFGSPLAGMTAIFLSWQNVFSASTVALIIMSIICFSVFTVFERKGIVKYNQYDRPKEAKEGSVRILIRHRIIRFTLIAIITGVVRTTVVFWMTTYFNEFLGYSADQAAFMYTVATLVISSAAFIAVFIYERLGGNMDLTIFIGFATSAVSFLLLYFLREPMVNVVLMVLAVLTSNIAACMLWSRYCPSLRDTGVVSSATGFLDFSSYMAASASSAIFANAVGAIGWDGLILIWFGLMIAGVITILPIDKLLRKKKI